MCKLIDKSSKFNTLLLYSHKNFYTLTLKIFCFFIKKYKNQCTLIVKMQYFMIKYNYIIILGRYYNNQLRDLIQILYE